MEETYYEKERREYREWLAQLKVGDKVAVTYRDWAFGNFYGIGTVVKITPTRKIDVRFFKDQEPVRYREDGGQQGGHYGDTIIPVTSEILETNRRHRAFGRICHLKNEDWLKLPVEALEAVFDIVEKHLPKKEE